MASPLTNYFDKKGYKQEKRDKIVELMRQHWLHWSDENHNKMTQSMMKDIFKTQEKIEKIERLFAREYTAFDRLFHKWRLKQDPAWEMINREMKKVDEQGICPFCNSKLHHLPKEAERPDVVRCNPCRRVYNLK